MYTYICTFARIEGTDVREKNEPTTTTTTTREYESGIKINSTTAVCSGGARARGFDGVVRDVFSVKYSLALSRVAKSASLSLSPINYYLPTEIFLVVTSYLYLRTNIYIYSRFIIDNVIYFAYVETIKFANNCCLFIRTVR